MDFVGKSRRAATAWGFGPAAVGPNVNRWLLLFLLAFCLAGVFGHGLWGPNDAREGGMIAEMARGGTLVVPTCVGEPYWEKPPLMFWIGAGLAKICGGPTAGLARLPSALAAFGALLLLYLFVSDARRRDDPAAPRWDAWAAVFACGTALLFLEYARVVLTDMTLTFWVALPVYLFWRAFARGARPLGYAPFVAATAFGFYAKGLIGPALVWSAVGLFLLFKRRFALIVGLGLATAAALALFVAPWALALRAYGGDAALRSVFWDNQFGRFFSFAYSADLPKDPYFVHKEPWHYYLRQVPPMLLPWLPLLLAAGWEFFKRRTPRRGDWPLLVRCAVVGMFVVLHASSAKVGVYALPIFPFIFAMFGPHVADAAAAERLSWPFRVAAWLSIGFAAVLAAGPAVVVLGGLAARNAEVAADDVAPWALAAAALVAVAAAVAATLLLVRAARRGARAAAWCLAPAAAAGTLGLSFVAAAPIVERHRTLEPVVAFVRAQGAPGREIAIATLQSDDPGGITFYLGRDIKVFEDEERAAAFLAEDPARGLLVRRSQVERISALVGGNVRALTVPHPGRRAQDYALLVTDAR